VAPPLLFASFRFRARLGFSIPSTFSSPRGIAPAFGYGAPHPGISPATRFPEPSGGSPPEAIVKQYV
jgi:hypothetical protein